MLRSLGGCSVSAPAPVFGNPIRGASAQKSTGVQERPARSSKTSGASAHEGKPRAETLKSCPWDDTLKRTENRAPASNVWALMSARGWLKGSAVQASAEEWNKDTLLNRLHSVRFSSRTDRYMQTFSISLVAMNTIYMGVQASIGLDAMREGKNVPGVFRYVDIIFALLFLLELAARIYLELGAFFTGPHCRWNAFDTILVMSSLLDILLYTWNFSFLRSLRALRAVRAARMIKSITFVRELRLMVASIMCSLSSLAWAFVLLIFVVYLFSVFLMQGLEVYINSIGRSPGGPLVQMYGTLGDSMYTLFCAISGGMDWSDAVKPFDEIWTGYRIVFVVYVLFVFLGVLNILTAIFVESAKHIAQVDGDIVIQDQLTHDKSSMNVIRRIFMDADEDCDGKLTRAELEKVLMEDKTVKHLSMFQLDLREVAGLFALLDIDDHNEVVIDEFVIQLMRLKGGAKGIDLQTLLYENKRIFCRLNAMMRFMEQHMGNVEDRLNIPLMDGFSMQEILMDEESPHKNASKHP